LIEHNSAVLFWAAAGVCGLASIYMLTRFLSSARRDRFIADTPLVRIRSAAQGYVRIEGRASSAAGDRMLAPLSRRPCVWWRYSILERVENAQRKKEWRRVDSGTSVTPFTLTDADASCLVGPVGADVTATNTDTWWGDSPRPNCLPYERSPIGFGEQNYRYTEEIVTTGSHLSVMGEFRSHSEAAVDDQVQQLLIAWKRDQTELLKKFDHNHDGRIDADEWEAARTAAKAAVDSTKPDGPLDRVCVVGQPTHGQPFLIAPLNEQQLHKRERRLGATALAASVVFLALAVWALEKALRAVG
jgi:hypothetical protein